MKMKCLLVGVAFISLTAAQSFLNDIAEPTTSCPCGWGTKGRIVGGKESESHAYPLVAGITLNEGTPFCGASIISERHALTAAHCTAEIKDRVSQMRLLVGAHDVRNARPEQFIPILATIEHPGYNSQNHEAHDISILVTSTPIQFRQEVGPACLPHKRLNLEGQYIRVLGWGLTLHEGKPSPRLREVDLRVIPFQSCQRAYANELQKFKSQFCTYERNKDSCQGDSGGPLIAIDPEINRYVLVGLVSFGRDCASENPAVNTDVSFYTNWVNEVVAQTSKRTLQTCSKVTSPFHFKFPFSF